jgi:hypothetical protein
VAKLTLKHNPQLDIEGLLQILQNKFGGEYEVYKTGLIGSDVVIKKSAWTGIALKLIQKADRTMIRFNAFAPSVFVRILQLGLLPILILYLISWGPMQKEIKGYLESAPELN